MMQNYQQQFNLVYNQMFGTFPDVSLKYHCRYERGLCLYHSLMYNRRKNCNSYNVCVNICTDNTNSNLCYGQILFFFYVEEKSFFFLKQFMNSKNKFSRLVKPIEQVKDWSMFMDKYYSILRRSMSHLVILPCSCIVSKCLFFPLNKDFLVCTPIELETEHD